MNNEKMIKELFETLQRIQKLEENIKKIKKEIGREMEMIRIKTLRNLIKLVEIIVEDYYTTGRYEYLSFNDYLELLDVERLAKAMNLSERTVYDYVAAVKKLYETLCQSPGKCKGMTDVCDHMTDVQEEDII